MKKLLNQPADFVPEMLDGLLKAHPDKLAYAGDDLHCIVRADSPVQGKVALATGGGSGHLPVFLGYVGKGMLDGCAVGDVFASPSADQMFEVTQRIHGGKGVVYIYGNYGGDVMNFDMAAELAAAAGIEVATVLTADDVAVTDSLYTAGRRGVGVTVLVEKIVGAAAEAGRDLPALAAFGQRVADSGRSMGLALTSCTVPAAGRPTFELADDEIELGIGIHGEPGRERQHMAPLRELARRLVTPILEDLDFTGSPVIVLCNGMGGTPMIELYGLFAEVSDLLKAADVQVARSLVGNYITSLEMAGASVTLLRADEEMLGYWDAPVSTPGLTW